MKVMGRLFAAPASLSYWVPLHFEHQEDFEASRLLHRWPLCPCKASAWRWEGWRGGGSLLPWALSCDTWRYQGHRGSLRALVSHWDESQADSVLNSMDSKLGLKGWRRAVRDWEMFLPLESGRMTSLLIKKTLVDEALSYPSFSTSFSIAERDSEEKWILALQVAPQRYPPTCASVSLLETLVEPKTPWVSLCLLKKARFKDMGVKQRGGVGFVQSEEPAVLGGVSLQHPPSSEGTKTQDNMKILAAIHCSYSHMRASAPGLLLQQIWSEFPGGKKKNKMQ